VKIALAQFGAGPETGANIEKAVNMIERAARDRDADLVVLPEFFNTIYFPQYPKVETYWPLAERADGPALSAIKAVAAAHRVHVVAPIYEEAHPGLHYDTAFLVDAAGEIRGRYRKTHAPLVEGGYEKLYYTAGTRYPVFDVHGWRCGITICYDWRFPEAARALGVQGAELIIMPFAARQTRMWHEALATRAWENQAYVAVCNKVGRDDGWLFSGRSFVVDPFGEIVVEAGSEGDELITATLDRETLRRARVSDFNWRDRRPELYAPLTTQADEIW
jgi:N-carbamoylputrescine amidase